MGIAAEQDSDHPPAPAYAIELADPGCEHCGRGKRWVVKGPTTVEEPLYSEGDAQQIAAELNAVFAAGAAHNSNSQP